MDPVSEIKSRLSIEDVAGEYLQLKRAGRNLKALSPFTGEKTPSFIVSPEKQIWHDFSSGRGGDVFSFVMEIESVDFRGALELLARKSGVDLDQFKSQGRKGPSKERLYATLELAAKFYQSHLKQKQTALEYIFQKRGFDKPTVLEFKIGYSPNSQKDLINFLANKGFSEQEIKLSGLSAIRPRGVSDMFRGRIMIPLMDQFGKVIGFTARLLEDSDNLSAGQADAPKYINTPQTPLYDKSRHVFGLHLAKKDIKDKGYSVIAEGNLDVVSSHQAGVKNVVAAAGTAITEFQLKTLSRLSTDVRLAFDQDRAGLAAAERAIPIASRAKVNLSIITVPAGKDPDELIRQDKKLWQKAIASRQYALDWLIARYAGKIDLASAQGKREFTDILVTVIKGLADDVEKDHYIGKTAEIAKVSPQAVKDKLSKRPQEKVIYKQPKNTKDTPAIDPSDKDWRRTGSHLLSLAIMLPGARRYLEIMTADMFAGEESKKVFEFLRARPDFEGSPEQLKDLAAGKKPGSTSQPAVTIRSLGNYVKILSLQFEELYGDVDMLELQYEAARLRAKTIRYFVKHQKTIISAQLKDKPDSRGLLERSRKLDQLLNKTRE
jgi:DNA primase